MHSSTQGLSPAPISAPTGVWAARRPTRVDSDKDGVADICSLPRTRRETAARQNAMERLGGELALYFGQLFADECTKAAETFGEPEKEVADECAAPRAAHAAGRALPAVRQAPIPLEDTSGRFFSGPVITSRTFCLNRSFGGPVTYPFDSDKDGVADICSLPRTRRAAVARQNAFERLAVEQGPRFNLLVAEECMRVPGSFGEPAAEAADVCAIGTGTATGTPLPTPGTGAGTGTGTGGTTTRPPQRPITPPTPPTATNPGKYNNRAAQNLLLDPGDGQITVNWSQVPSSNPDRPDDDDPYDSDDVYEYEVWWAQKGRGWSTNNRKFASGTDYAIEGLANFITYNVRVKAVRGSRNDPFTPTLTSTPGLAGPPIWPGEEALRSDFYGQITADWDAPHGASDDGINHYLLQWSTSRSSWSASRQASVNVDDDTAYTIKGLSNGTHYVRVQGVGKNGPGTWSLTESLRLTSTRPSPGQPTGATLNTAGTGTELSVNWKKPDRAEPSRQPTHYLVQWRNLTARESWSANARQTAVQAPATTYRIPNLLSRNQYEVRVQAVNQDIAGSWSSTAKIVLGEAAAPANIKLSPGSRRIEVKWDDVASVPAVGSYVLQWNTSSSFPRNCATSTRCDQASPAFGSGPTGYSITDLDNDRRYYVRMRSVNSGPGPWSSTVSVEPGTIKAPKPVLAEEDTDHIRQLDVIWTPTNETGKPALTGFKIRWRSGTQSWSSSRQTTLSLSDKKLNSEGGDYAFTISNLLTGVEHEVRILATNSYGDGPWSASSKATPGESFIPTGVEIALESGDQTNIEAQWGHSSGSLTVNSFTVQWRTCGTSGFSCGSWGSSRSTSDGTASSLAIPGTSLRDGIYYQARVRANGPSSSGGSSAYEESKKYLVKVDDNDDTVTLAPLS